MGCCSSISKNTQYEAIYDQNHNVTNIRKPSNKFSTSSRKSPSYHKILSDHQKLTCRRRRTISTQIIRKIYCYLLRSSFSSYSSYSSYFSYNAANLSIVMSVLVLITNYIEIFFVFNSALKYSEIFLSNNNQTATILSQHMFTPSFGLRDYSQCGDRLILFGLPIFPRKHYIYKLTIKIDKCASQTIAMCLMSDYYYFYANYLNNSPSDMWCNVINPLDKYLLYKCPNKYGSYSLFCNGKDNNTWTSRQSQSKHAHIKHKLLLYNKHYLNNINICNLFNQDDEKAEIFSDGKYNNQQKNINFSHLGSKLIIIIDGINNVLKIQTKHHENEKDCDGEIILNIPNCYKYCLNPNDYDDKINNLNNLKYCYNISNNKNEFIYPSIKDELDDIEGDERHISKFQIGFALYDGDDSHGQVSIVDQSWTYFDFDH